MKKHQRRAKKRSKAYALLLKRLKERKVFKRIAQRMTDRFSGVAKYVVTRNHFRKFWMGKVK